MKTILFLITLFAWLLVAGCTSRTTPLAFTPAPTLAAVTPITAAETPSPAATVALQTLGIATLAPQPAFQPVLSVGLVTDGAKSDDGSLSQSVYAGLQRSAAEAPVVVALIESLRDEDIALNLATFAQSGFDLIVTVGEQGAAAAAELAPGYPASHFVIVDAPAAQPAANVHLVLFNDEQLGLAAGVWAGAASQSGVVGLVTAAEPARAEALNRGYATGVRQSCPACTVLNTALGMDEAAALGRAAALRQIGEGADVILGAGGAAGNGALLGAAQQAVWAIGLDDDAFLTVFTGDAQSGSTYLLGSVVKRADEAIYQLVSDTLAGKSLPAQLMMDARNGGIGIAPRHGDAPPAPPEVEALLQR